MFPIQIQIQRRITKHEAGHARPACFHQTAVGNYSRKSNDLQLKDQQRENESTREGQKATHLKINGRKTTLKTNNREQFSTWQGASEVEF